MDYLGMAKRAWAITWRYRVLWLFGFLAGASGGGSNFNTYRYSTGSGEYSGDQFPQLDRATSWVSDNLAAIIALTVLLVLIGICFFILSVAARGGLVHLASRADEGIAPTVREGFAAGFHSWGRVFLIGLALYAPFAILVALIVVPTVVLPVAAAIGAGDAGSGGGVFAALLGMVGVLVVEIIVFAILSVVLSIIEMLALRHGVLDDVPAIQSIKAAAHDVRTRFVDVFVMWLVNMGIGIVVGIAFGVVAAIFGVMIVGAAISGLWPLAIVIGVVTMLVFIVPSAIVSAFYSTLWTVFYRRFTGRDGAAAASVGAPAGTIVSAAPAYDSEVPAAPAPPSDFLPPPPSPPGE